MPRKRRYRKKRKEDIRTIKRDWGERTLIFSGFALLLFFLISLSLEGVIAKFPYNTEIALVLITALTISFFAERALKIKRGTVYEIFYSVYLAVVLLVLGILYWITYLNNIDIGIFRTLIVLTEVIVFLYSLSTIKHSDKFWFIVLSYIFTVLITIIVFAYIYWTISLFGIGHLQFTDCSVINPSLISENWFYFSSETFYSLGYGDICPVENLTRITSQIEVGLGALINTILIGFIFWKIRIASVEERLEKKKK